jgi:subtilisin family serine protease
MRGQIYIITYDESSTKSQIKAFITRNRLIVKQRFSNSLVVTIPKNSYDALSKDPFIVSIENDLECKLSSEIVPWGISRIDAEDSSTAVMGNVNVDVFIIDTGVSLHPDLNVVQRRNYSNESTLNDRNGHGTAVAGVIGAYANGQYVRGVAPGVRIRSYKALNRNGSGTSTRIIRAINAVIRWKRLNPSKPAVLNLSLGANTNTTNYNSLDRAVLSAVNNGIVVCIAAGNSGINAAFATPAHVEEAITVGAYDVNNVMPVWSNYGSIIDILAPGVGVIMLSPNRSTLVSASGTSFSCPHVAGCCALYLANNPFTTPEQMSQILKNNAIALNDPAINVGSRIETTTESVTAIGF